MVDNNQNIDKQDQETIINELRMNVDQREVDAPVGEKSLWAPREFNLTRATWIVRSLTVLLAVVFIGEVWLLMQNKPQAEPFTGFAGGPTMEVVPAPVVNAPLPAPPVEGAEQIQPPDESFPPLPTPTEPPLPPELEGVEIPPVDT